MQNTSRRFAAAVLTFLLAASPIAADTGQPPPEARSNTGKRIVWAVVGAAAGFGAGLFLGLNQFDDAIDSDRKVWTSAIVGAAGGAVAGALLSRNVKPSLRPPTPLAASNPSAAIDVSWDKAIGRPASGQAPGGAKAEASPVRH